MTYDYKVGLRKGVIEDNRPWPTSVEAIMRQEAFNIANLLWDLDEPARSMIVIRAVYKCNLIDCWVKMLVLGTDDMQKYARHALETSRCDEYGKRLPEETDNE